MGCVGCKLCALINMITYGLVKQVGPYSKNEPSSYNPGAQNTIVMSPRYPYDASGESTSIHNRSLWAARLVSDAGNLEDPKTSLQYAKAQQKKENLTIVLGNLFGNTFAVAPPTEPQQPQGRNLGKSPMVTNLFLAGLEALNYELRRQRSALEGGVSSPAWSDYSFPGVAPVTPQPYAQYPYVEDKKSATPSTAYGTPGSGASTPSSYGTPGSGTSYKTAESGASTPSSYGTATSTESVDITWAEKILSQGLAAMDVQLAESISDQQVKQEIQSDVSDVWKAISDIGSVDLEYEVARDRFQNMANEIQTAVSTTRQVQQSILAAQSPISEMAPKRILLDQSLQTAGLPTVGETPTVPRPMSTPDEAAFDILLNRLKRVYRTMEDKQFQEYYDKQIAPYTYTPERLQEENQVARRRVSELPSTPAKDPSEIALEVSPVPSVQDLTLLRSGRVSRERQKQATGPYSKALDKVRNVIDKFGVWAGQPLRFLQPGVWTPSQGISYVYPDQRGAKRERDEFLYGQKRRTVEPSQGIKRGKKQMDQETKQMRPNPTQGTKRGKKQMDQETKQMRANPSQGTKRGKKQPPKETKRTRTARPPPIDTRRKPRVDYSGMQNSSASSGSNYSG